MYGTCITTEYCGTKRKTTQRQLTFSSDEGREEQLINLYPHITDQTLGGFGGAITESAAYIYSLLSQKDKKRLLTAYFGKDGMNYRFVRISLDSCDFSLSHYEADGDPADELLEHFSFERMEQYVLPMLWDAEAVYGGKLEIMLSPWSPPAFMKTNGERNHGGKLKAEFRKRWAEYICRYILEMKQRGFNVTMLTLQNEPKAVQAWDSCIYTAQEEKAFLRDHLWPALVRHGLEKTQVFIWDHNKERALEWAEEIFDAQTEQMTSGVAFHWYSGDHFEALQMIHARFPEKTLLLSEACIEFSKYSEHSNLANAQQYAHDILGNLNAGMSVFLDWNLILDEQGGPNHANNYCDAPYMLHVKENRLEERELQAYIWHFSHFLVPGAVRIGVSRYTDKLEVTAFRTDKQIAVVLLNRADEEIPTYLRLCAQCAGMAVPPRSIASCVITL